MPLTREKNPRPEKTRFTSETGQSGEVFQGPSGNQPELLGPSGWASPAACAGGWGFWRSLWGFLSRTGRGSTPRLCSAARKDTSSISTMILQVSMLKPSDLMSWPRRQRMMGKSLGGGAAVLSRGPPPPPGQKRLCVPLGQGPLHPLLVARGLAGSEGTERNVYLLCQPVSL